MDTLLKSASQTNILLIDDNPDNLRLLAKMLESQGYVLCKSLSGRMALQAAQDQLSKLMGGKMLVETHLEEGSTFYFTIRVPASYPVPTREANVQATSQTNTQPSHLISLTSAMAEKFPLRILLAEDHAVNQKLALLMLKQLGYRADVVSNGKEVLEIIQHLSYDVILMDVQMPEMDGLEATKLICQKYPVGLRPRIIALTARALQGDREECLAAGMDDYLSKPICIEILAHALSRCVPIVSTNGGFIPPNRSDRQSHPLNQPLTNPALIPIADLPAINTQAMQKIYEMAGDDETFVLEIIDCYLEDSPHILEQMREAVIQGDTTTVHRLAHSWKSSSAYLGARNLTEICREIEAIALSEISHLPERLHQLEAEFERVKTALQLERQKRLLISPIPKFGSKSPLQPQCSEN